MLETQTSTAFRFGFLFLAFSIVLWIVTTVCFIGAWDHVAALTTFPQWSWAILGILSAAIAWRLMRRWRRGFLSLLFLWLLAVILFADNLVPIVRRLLRGAPALNSRSAGTLRVVTLNCASSPAAIGEAMALQPDIVLLQECPHSNKVFQVGQKFFGEAASMVVGLDCAILSRFRLTSLEARPPVHYTRAILTLPTNREIIITSLRFTPPLGAMDLWRPATWRAYLADRRLRREQLQSVLDSRPARLGVAEIMGGDFNAPARDGIYRLMHQYADSHRVAGRGWGGTAIDTLPIFRPDQLWVRGLRPVASCAVRAFHSDHRMVMTDLSISP